MSSSERECWNSQHQAQIIHRRFIIRVYLDALLTSYHDKEKYPAAGAEPNTARRSLLSMLFFPVDVLS